MGTVLKPATTSEDLAACVRQRLEHHRHIDPLGLQAP